VLLCIRPPEEYPKGRLGDVCERDHPVGRLLEYASERAAEEWGHRTKQLSVYSNIHCFICITKSNNNEVFAHGSNSCQNLKLAKDAQDYGKNAYRKLGNPAA
jgi:hypothetical protein